MVAALGGPGLIRRGGTAHIMKAARRWIARMCSRRRDGFIPAIDPRAVGVAVTVTLRRRPHPQGSDRDRSCRRLPRRLSRPRPTTIAPRRTARASSITLPARPAARRAHRGAAGRLSPSARARAPAARQRIERDRRRARKGRHEPSLPPRVARFRRHRRRLPDAAPYGDAGADTLGHIAEACREVRAPTRAGAAPRSLRLPNLTGLGLGLGQALHWQSTGRRPPGLARTTDPAGAPGFAVEAREEQDRPQAIGDRRLPGRLRLGLFSARPSPASRRC